MISSISLPPPPISFNAPVLTSLTVQDWHRFVPENDPILKQLQQENTAWQRFKNFFTKRSVLEKRIEAISQQKDLSADWNSSLPAIIECLNSSNFYRVKPAIRKILLAVNKEQQTDLFNALTQKCIENETSIALNNCLSLIPWKELVHMLPKDSASIEDTIKVMSQCHSHSVDQEQKNAAMIKTSAGKYLASWFHGILDTFLMAISFFEIGKEPASSWDASYLLKAYATILSAPLAIFAALSFFFSVLYSIAITAAVVLVIVLLLLAYVKWWKPPPENVEPCVNLTALAKAGLLMPVIGRDEEVERLISALMSGTFQIFDGASGVGKTTIAVALAIRIAQGTVPDEMKDLQVLLLDTETSSEKVPFQSQNKLQRMMKRIGNDKNKYIIFFDEFHVITKKESKICNQFKLLVNDDSPAGLRYVVAATNQFQEILKDDGIKRRFERREIKATDEQTTLWILRELARRKAPEFIITEQNLKVIYDATTNNNPLDQQPNSNKDKAQPAASKRMLLKVISNMRQQLDGYRPDDDLEKMRAEHSSLLSQYHFSQSPDLLSKIISLEGRISNLASDRKDEKNQLQILSHLYRYRSQQKSNTFKMAADILKSSSQDSEKHKKLFLFTKEYLLKFLNEKIDSMGNVLRIKPINQLIQNEIDGA